MVEIHFEKRFSTLFHIEFLIATGFSYTAIFRRVQLNYAIVKKIYNFTVTSGIELKGVFIHIFQLPMVVIK